MTFLSLIVLSQWASCFFSLFFCSLSLCRKLSHCQVHKLNSLRCHFCLGIVAIAIGYGWFGRCDLHVEPRARCGPDVPRESTTPISQAATKTRKRPPVCASSNPFDQSFPALSVLDYRNVPNWKVLDLFTLGRQQRRELIQPNSQECSQRVTSPPRELKKMYLNCYK